MPLLQRITTPFVALLPDVQHVPPRRQAVVAITASLVVHLILFLVYVAVKGFIPTAPVEFKHAKAELQPLEVQIVDQSAMVAVIPEAQEEELVKPEELKAREREVIDSTGLTATTTPVKDAIFESDQAMKAGSEKPATGDLPLPSQDGRAMDHAMFANQQAKLGSTEVPPADAIASIQPAPPTPPLPAPIPPPVDPAPAEDEAASELPPPPTPNQMAEAKPEPPVGDTPPPPAPEVIDPTKDEIPVAQRFVPAPNAPITRLEPPREPVQPKPKVKPAKVKPPQEFAKLATPSPRREPPPLPAPGYQEEQTKTRVDGGISNRGPNGVDADRTPRGVYMKKLKAQIGSRWYYYMKQRRDLYSVGSATIAFAITETGKVSSVRIIENTSNTAFSLMCQQCVIEAEITPPPEEVVTMMPNGRLEETFTFNYVPFH